MHQTPPSHRIPDRVRLPLAFDPARLTSELASLADVVWTPHFVQQNYAGDWSAIALRSVAGETHPIRLIYADPAAKSFVDTPVLDFAPYYRDVLAQFKCPLRCVRLMRLTPGSIIKEHSDVDLAAEAGFVRIHVPVTTNPDVDFRLNGLSVAMQPGSTWYLRLSDPHSVANHGTTDRVHLVIDSEVNDWLMDMLERGVGAPPPA
jgi:hypothetical protein